MKQKLLFALFLLVSFFSEGQTYLRELSQDHKSGLPRREAAFSLVDSTTKDLYLTFVSKNKLCLNVYNDFKKLAGYCFDRTEDPGLFSQINAAILKKGEDRFSLLFSNPTSATFSVTHVHLKSQAIERKASVIDLKKDEVFLHAFSKGDLFYVWAIVKKSSVLKMYEYDTRTDAVSETSSDFSGELSAVYKNTTIWEVINYQKSDLYRTNWYGYVQNINVATELDPDVISRVMKFFVVGDSITMVVDNYNKMTLLFTLHLPSKQFGLDKMAQVKMTEDPMYCSANSYLFEDKLLQVRASSELISIRIVSLAMKKQLAEFVIRVDDKTIPFPSSPISSIMKAITFMGRENNKDSIKVKRFVKDAAANNVFVGAMRNKKGRLEMYVGSYFIVKTYYGNGGSSSSQVFNAFSFLVNEETWQAEKGELSKKMFNRLYEMQAEVDCPAKAQTVFELDRKWYLGYFKTIYDSPQSLDYKTYYVVDLVKDK